MKLLSYALPDNHNWILGGDEHEGAKLRTQTGWECLVDLLMSKYDGCRNNYFAEGGDMLEAITVDDKRFSPEMMTMPVPLMQAKLAVELRKPIKSRIKYMLQGNHERALSRFGDLVEMMCDDLKIDYGTYTAKVAVKSLDGKPMYKLFDTHGRRNITSTADDPKRRRVNMQLILKRQLKFKAADCAVMVQHHIHKVIVSKPESELYLTDDGEKIKHGYTSWGQGEQFIHPDARWYGSSGSLLRLYGDGFSGYGEVGGYDPTEIGVLILKVRDRKIVELEPYYLDI